MAEYQPLGIQNFTGQVGVSPDILQFLQGVSGQAFGMGNRVLGQREKEYATQLALQQAREQQALRMQREQQALQNYYAQFQQPLPPMLQALQASKMMGPQGGIGGIAAEYLKRNPEAFKKAIE